MKSISYKQSRKNSARRGRKAKVRRARARGGRAGSKPVFGPGRIHLEIGDRIGAMSFGGIGVMRRLVSRLGLVREIDRRLHLLKRHLPYRESDHVLNIAYNILCGSTRLEDLNGLRNNVPYLDALDAEMIPSPTAAGDFMRRFEQEDVVELMEALGAVRPQLWKGRGRELLGPVAYVDVDGTVAPTQGEKKAGMDMSYKGVWGYHPLIISLANTGEVLSLVNRPGNVPSHTGAAEWIGRSIDLVAPHVERVCVRGDTHFSLTAHFDEWSEKADFIFGYRSCPVLEAAVSVLDEESWQPLKAAPALDVPVRADACQAPERERPDRGGAWVHELEAELRAHHRVRVPSGEVPQEVPDGRGQKEHQQDEGRQHPVRRDPLSLLHHHAHRRERGRTRSAGQPAR